MIKSMSEEIESEKIFEKLGEIIMADIKAIEKYIYNSLEQCHQDTTENLQRKLGHLIFSPPSKGGLRKDTRLKEDLLRTILNESFPKIEGIVNTIGSLSPDSIAEIRDAMVKYAFPVVKSSD
ncbi:hypothetical protein TWF718_001826 [Orbilia javanica]|uniref:Uncharacterized protein n=1 Tax=Orbilia javanica TaxID=47235 RepID=A0AAN8MVT8_9PEZI